MRPPARSGRRVPCALLLAAVWGLLLADPATGQAMSCAGFSSTSTAQFALDINPALADTLDPDGNGIACDDDASGQPGTAGASRQPTDLQLPDPATSHTAPETMDDLGTINAIDQQPTDQATLPVATITPERQQQSSPLDGRIGSSRDAWEQIVGPPIGEQPGSRPGIALATYPPVETARELFALWLGDRATIIVISAEQSWSDAEVAPILLDLLPPDIGSLPAGEVLADGSLLIPMFSEQLAGEINPAAMASAGVPGVPGDLYVLLITDGGSRAVEIEIGIGNGDNVREDINTGPPAPTPSV